MSFALWRGKMECTLLSAPRMLPSGDRQHVPKAGLSPTGQGCKGSYLIINPCGRWVQAENLLQVPGSLQQAARPGGQV